MSRESQRWVTFLGNDYEVSLNSNLEQENVTPQSLGLLRTQWRREKHEKKLLSRSNNKVRDPEEISNNLQTELNQRGAIWSILP